MESVEYVLILYLGLISFVTGVLILAASSKEEEMEEKREEIIKEKVKE